MRKTTRCLTMLAVFAMLCTLPLAAWAGGSPQDACDSFFGALKKGDLTSAKAFFSGAALKTPPKEGSRQYQLMKLWGEAYLGVESLKVEGDTATGFLKMDGKKIADAMMGPRKAMLDKITDPAEKAKEMKRYQVAYDSFATKLSKMPVTLKKEGGTWKIQEVK